MQVRKPPKQTVEGDSKLQSRHGLAKALVNAKSERKIGARISFRTESFGVRKHFGIEIRSGDRRKHTLALADLRITYVNIFEGHPSGGEMGDATHAQQLLHDQIHPGRISQQLFDFLRMLQQR